jgi:hypothetical protein
MDNQVGILTGFSCLTPDIRPDLNCMIGELTEELDRIMSCVIEPATQFAGIARQWHKFDPMFCNKTLKATRRSQFDRVTVFHKPESQGQKGLDIALRPIRKDRDFHADILPVPACYTVNGPRKGFANFWTEQATDPCSLIQIFSRES